MSQPPVAAPETAAQLPPAWPPPSGTTARGSLPPAAVATAPAHAPAASGKTRKIVSYALVGTGAALLVTSLVEGQVARNRAKAVATASQNDEPFDPEVDRQGRNASIVAVVTGILGVGAAAAGAILWLTAPREESASPRGARVAEAVVAPVLGPGVLGASASVRF